jgi:ATP-dependent Zn protease
LSVSECAGLADYGKVIDILDEMSEQDRRDVIDDAHKRAREIIIANRAKVARVAQHLIDKGNITGTEFVVVMKAAD